MLKVKVWIFINEGDNIFFRFCLYEELDEDDIYEIIDDGNDDGKEEFVYFIRYIKGYDGKMLLFVY